jgi:hypothetical protein
MYPKLVNGVTTLHREDTSVMPISKGIEEHILRLVDEAPLFADNPTALPWDTPTATPGSAMAWLISAQHAVQIVCPSTTNAYNLHANRIVTDPLFAASRVSQMRALLLRLWKEIEDGLLATIENHVIAATVDNFLDHGAEYLKHGRKDEAAVIAGIVFEDTIRRICRVLDGERRRARDPYLRTGEARSPRSDFIEGQARPRRLRIADLRGSRPVGGD